MEPYHDLLSSPANNKDSVIPDPLPLFTIAVNKTLLTILLFVLS